MTIVLNRRLLVFCKQNRVTLTFTYYSFYLYITLSKCNKESLRIDDVLGESFLIYEVIDKSSLH